MALSRKIKTIFYGFLSIVLFGYLVVSLCVVDKVATEKMCTGLQITVYDTEQLGFMGHDDVIAELGSLPRKTQEMRLSDINIDSIENYLKAFDKIEDANVTVLTSGKLHIEVWPMQPVMRIFTPDGSSYYLNRQGKKMTARARYYIDVPVVSGAFAGVDSIVPFIMPLLEYIESDTLWNRAIDGVKVNNATEVILIPALYGHVVNFGAPDNIPDKFRRLKSFYSKAMPRKGWLYYDTVSVKWNGQVVASRRKKIDHTTIPVEAEEYNETDNDETMSAGDNIAPGQALPGIPAVSDKPVPGAVNLTNNN